MAQQLDIRYVRFYTDGSAARKVKPVEPYKILKLPKKKAQKRRVIHIDPLAIAGIVMSVVMTVLMLVGVVELMDAREDAANMASYAQELKEINDELTATYRNGYTIEEVRQAADNLGLVPMDQVTHIQLNLNDTPDGPVRVQEENNSQGF